MLVLSRKLNETIVINGDIRVTVVSIHGNQVRLGIEAPESVRIFREETLRTTGFAQEQHPGSQPPERPTDRSCRNRPK